MKRDSFSRRWPKRLVEWFDRAHRPMPWRDDPTPYHVWISEVMLQQTQVSTVIPYYDRFIARFPNVRELAAADIQDVLRCWEGLGYYSRARNLHRAANHIVKERQGSFPTSRDEWIRLPGIGPYTAAAVASIAHGEPVPAVDGNVLRVCARLWGIEEDIRDRKVADRVASLLTPLVRMVNPSSFNQAMMETGALICRPRQPQCGECTLRSGCVAYRMNRTADLPVTTRAPRVPHYRVAVGVIWKRGRLLIARRHERQMLGGLWEFPGGKPLRGESLRRAARREIREETGLDVIVGCAYATIRHAYSHFSITMTAFCCDWVAGRARPKAASELKWIAPAQLKAYPLPRANRRIADILTGEP